MTHTTTHVPARMLLDGVEQCGYEKTASVAFAGATAVCMRFLGEPVTNDYVMGITGGAFMMYWTPPWAMWNCDLLIIGEEPVRRTFDAMGYAYTSMLEHELPHQVTKEYYRERIMDHINRSAPVIAFGVVGPPEVCTITGYDQNGEVLLGWSYFQDNPNEVFVQPDWYANIYGLILIGEKKTAPAPQAVLRDTLEWAINLARTPRLTLTTPTADGVTYTYSGLASFDAMAEALQRDEDFPAGNLDVLTAHANAASNDGPWLNSDLRRVASAFLQQMIEKTQPHPSATHLWKAAELYARESAVWRQAAQMAPWTGAPVEERLQWADPNRRRDIAQLVREAKAIEEQAVTHLETALTTF